jgi:DNA-binding transcriptional LysR family regulator
LKPTSMRNASSISLRQMRCFVTVAEELHFRRAAEKLHMRQPPLTQRIRDMERDLGVELFRRTGNKIELTDAGRMVLKAVKETLVGAECVGEVAQRAARGECGRIRVGLVIAALFFDSIQQAMRVFQAEHPDVSLDLTQASSGLALEGLRQRKLDVCLVRPFSTPLPLDCEETTIERDRLMLVLPAVHPQARARKIPLSAIADEKFISIACKKGHALYDQVMNLWEKSGLQPRIAQEARTGRRSWRLSRPAWATQSCRARCRRSVCNTSSGNPSRPTIAGRRECSISHITRTSWPSTFPPPSSNACDGILARPTWSGSSAEHGSDIGRYRMRRYFLQNR